MGRVIAGKENVHLLVTNRNCCKSFIFTATLPLDLCVIISLVHSIHTVLLSSRGMNKCNVLADNFFSVPDESLCHL